MPRGRASSGAGGKGRGSHRLLRDARQGPAGWAGLSHVLPLQSLDYDNCENQLFLEEERRINHTVSRPLGGPGGRQARTQVSGCVCVSSWHAQAPTLGADSRTWIGSLLRPCLSKQLAPWVGSKEVHFCCAFLF